MHSGVFTTLDFDADGKHQASISIPHSVDRSPYYQITTPICRLKNGDGPSILIIAGNHGDEYEGAVALIKLFQALDPKDITGSITLVPAINAGAVDANRRCSRFDGGNLNRSFPGDPSAGPTQKLAAFIRSELLPKHDVLFDIHSGGTSMEHIACALMEVFPDQKQHAKGLELLTAMGLPFAFLADHGPDTPTSMGAARRAGCIGISGEFGGGACLTETSLQNTTRAIDNVLLNLGILKKPVFSDRPIPGTRTQFLEFKGQDVFVFSPKKGWAEPTAGLGDLVKKGQLAARLYDLFAPEIPPKELFFQTDGIVMARRLHCHTEIGDCLFALGRPI